MTMMMAIGMVMRRLWLSGVLVVTVALAGGCGVGGGDDALGLSVMSFNIRYGTADDGENSWPYRREFVIDLIRQLDPDVLGVQEALRFQLDELRGELSGLGEIGVGRDDGLEAGEYSAILYKTDRFDVTEHGTFWFSDEPETAGSVGWGAGLPRICTWARLVARSSGRAFYVYNIHLDHQSQESRERSVRLLVERIEGRAHPDPVVVTGDFNAGEDNPAMMYLLGSERQRGGLDLRDSYRALFPDAMEVGTFNGFRGETTGPKIDAVLVSSEWKVGWAAIVRAARDGRYLSDHFPVMATISLGS